MRLPVPISGVSAHQGAFVELTAKDTIVLADFVNTTGELGFDGTLSRRQPFSCIALDRFADVQSRLLAKGGTCPKCSRVEGCSAWFRFFLSSLKLQKVLRSLTGWAAVALGMLMCGILEDLNTPHAPARANIGGFGTPRGLC